MMTDEAPPPSSSSDTTMPPPEPDPPPNRVQMSSPSPSTASQQRVTRSRAHSSGTSEDNQSSSPNSSSTPPWIRWSRGLSSLLDDQQGRDLFEKYLDQEGCSAQLNFLWACEGLKCTAIEDPPKIPQMVRTIHRHFFQNITLHGISDGTRSDLAQAIVREGRYDEVDLFDKAEAEVQIHMQDNLYPNFLKSEIYLCAVNGEEESSNFLQQLECRLPDSSPTGRKSSVGDSSSLGGGEELRPSLTAALEVDVEHKSHTNSGGGQSPQIPSPPLSVAPSVLLSSGLQTLPEDKELSVSFQQPGCSKKLAFGLTRKALQKTSEIRSREGLMSHYKPGTTSTTVPLHPYHASYSSYNPVSRVDSEIQSISSASDAMTDDGAHSGHGQSRSRRHDPGAHSHRSRGHLPSHSASGSRSQSQAQAEHLRGQERIHVANLNKDSLPFDKLFQPSRPDVNKGPGLPVPQKTLDVKEFARVLTEKLLKVKSDREAKDKLNQRLRDVRTCDDHAVVPNENVLAAAINKLQVQEQDDGTPDDILNQHFARVFSDTTPDNRSPKLRSPTSGRRRGGPTAPPVRPRRERDLISTFSGDSGNVHDLYPSDTLPSSMTKSRSMPAEMRLHDHGSFPGMGAHHHLRHLSRGGVIGHGESRNVMAMTRKTSSEFIDSGISVVSGATPSILSTNQPTPSLPCDRTESRITQWLHEGCGDDRSRPRSTTSPPPMMRRPKKPPVPPHAIGHCPPVAPPSLEEVRKRLVKKTGLPSAVLASQSVQVPLGPGSSSSANANPLRHHSPPMPTESMYSIPSFVYYEGTEVPYSVKMPCRMFSGKPSGITLALFKEHLPKRGNFRYFFKRECAEVEAKAVQEEITDDFQELPLFEGKIIAHLQVAVSPPGTSGVFTVDKI